MAKGPGVSATSHIIAQSQTNIHYYSDPPKQKQQNFYFMHPSNVFLLDSFRKFMLGLFDFEAYARFGAIQWE